MKFGKEFQQILDNSSFPDEWRASAIEYRQLKKLIKNVVNELSSMGLSPNVLHKLLVTDNDQHESSTRTQTSPLTEATVATVEPFETDEDVFEFEIESKEGSPLIAMNQKVVKHSPKEIVLDPIKEPDEDIVSDLTSTYSSPNPKSSLHHHKFRLKLVSESHSATSESSSHATAPRPSSPLASLSPRPTGISDMLQTSGNGTDDHDAVEHQFHSRKVIKRAFSEDITAEYVLSAAVDHVVPQILLHVAHHTTPKSSSPTIPLSPVFLSTEIDSIHEFTEYKGEKMPSSLPSTSMELRAPKDLRAVPEIDVIPPSPRLVKMRNVPSPIWTMATADEPNENFNNFSIGGSLINSEPQNNGFENSVPDTRQSNSPGHDFIIPLHSDLAFFNLLMAALTSLNNFHRAQQVAFKDSVFRLCQMVSQSIQPGSSIHTLSTPLAPSTPLQSSSRITCTSHKASHKDLYAWREIFGLWVESQIFESSTERSRGERSIEEAETRLKMFANEVVKRGLGDRRTMKGKQVQKAWEEFLGLNMLLLDLKRFQTANINAARKILKKHDKQTSLVASTHFSDFVRTTLSQHVDKDGNVNTWEFYDTSLPHILLSCLTETLLPILPSLDDYACLICTSIAFKPIRLSCGHLFCVRCLVKMQREGKENCPLCRAKTVLLADKSCLDQKMMLFMKEWFPKEIKAKQKENEVESAKEAIEDAGLDSRCIIA